MAWVAKQVTNYLWDAAGRQVGISYPLGKALTYTLDPNGNRVVLLDSDGGLTSYSWDAVNRLVGILNPYNEQTTIQYDALDRESLKTLANGMKVSHLFDNAGREVLLSNLGTSGPALSMYTASYDAAGNQTAVVELDGTRVTFGYDRAYQLVNEQRSGSSAYNTTYQYDAVGNRTVKNDSGALTSYLYNTANELTLTTPATGQPTTSSYDANGNLAVENSGGQLTSYSWDSENRLVGVAYPTTARDTFSYSADGKRQKKVTGTGTVQFVWDEENVLLETDQNGVTQAHYTDFPGSRGGLASQRRSGTSSFYGFDLQANTRLLVTLLGVISDSYLYKAFGEEVFVTGSSINPLRFGGREGYYRDLLLRLYIRARELRPDLGRWMSRDPLAALGIDWDPYRYISNRPTARTDPLGLLGPCTTTHLPYPNCPESADHKRCGSNSTAYRQRYNRCHNPFDACASCVTNAICVMIESCDESVCCAALGQPAGGGLDCMLYPCLAQINDCMLDLWKKRTTREWRYATRVCAEFGENSFPCCKASLQADQAARDACAKGLCRAAGLFPGAGVWLGMNVARCCAGAPSRGKPCGLAPR